MVSLLRCNAEMETDADGCQHIVDIIGTDEMCLNLIPFDAFIAPAEFEERSTIDYFAPHITVFILTIRNHTVQFTCLCHLHQMLIICIDEYQSIMSGQKVIEFTLSILDTFETTEALEMCSSHIGNHTAGRFHIFHQLFDVTGMTGTHLHNGNLMLVTQTQQGLGHTHIVVEVALGKHHIIFLSQYGGNQFFGCGLPVGAGDADYRNIKLAAMLTGKFLEGGEAVIHQNEARLS